MQDALPWRKASRSTVCRCRWRTRPSASLRRYALCPSLRRTSSEVAQRSVARAFLGRPGQHHGIDGCAERRRAQVLPRGATRMRADTRAIGPPSHDAGARRRSLRERSSVGAGLRAEVDSEGRVLRRARDPPRAAQAAEPFGALHKAKNEELIMSDKPVFIYAATYADAVGAEADYDTLLELHEAKLVGTYDVALVTKDANGKVHVEKHEKPTQHGAWGGIAVGAAVGVLAAPAVVPAALVGGVIGGLGGHFKKGISRGDAKELGDLIEAGQATLLVIGESRLEEQLDKVLTRAEKTIEREIDVDNREFKRELKKAEKEAAVTS